MQTKRQAIAEARDCANAIIEQLERRARGWDKGAFRDDVSPADRPYRLTIAEHLEACSQMAFEAAKVARPSVDYDRSPEPTSWQEYERNRT